MLQQQGAAWAECTCAGARFGISPSFCSVEVPSLCLTLIISTPRPLYVRDFSQTTAQFDSKGNFWCQGRNGVSQTNRCDLSLLFSQSVRNYSPGNMEQAPSRGHEASPQSGLGVGCKRCSSSKKLRGLGVRAQARRIGTSLSHSMLRFFSRSCLPRVAR